MGGVSRTRPDRLHAGARVRYGHDDGLACGAGEKGGGQWNQRTCPFSLDSYFLGALCDRWGCSKLAIDEIADAYPEVILWHRDWYEVFDDSHIGEMLRHARTMAKESTPPTSTIPADWHPFQ